MKITEFRKLIREEVRKTLNEAPIKTAPVPTTDLVYVPMEDVVDFGDFVFDGGLMNNIFYMKAGVLVNKRDVKDLEKVIARYEKYNSQF